MNAQFLALHFWIAVWGMFLYGALNDWDWVGRLLLLVAVLVWLYYFTKADKTVK